VKGLITLGAVQDVYQSEARARGSQTFGEIAESVIPETLPYRQGPRNSVLTGPPHENWVPAAIALKAKPTARRRQESAVGVCHLRDGPDNDPIASAASRTVAGGVAWEPSPASFGLLLTRQN
jgi:hypothetical protein